MKKYQLLSGFLSLFVAVFLIYSMRYRVPFFLFLLIPASLFFSIYKLGSMKKNVKGLSLFFNIVSLISIACFLICCLFIAFNLPAGKAFDEKLEKVSYNNVSGEMYDQINFRMKQLSIILKNDKALADYTASELDKYNYSDKTIETTLKDSINIRTELLKLFLSSPFFAPEKYYEDRYLETTSLDKAFYGPRETQTFQAKNYLSFFKLELSEINKNINTGDYKSGLLIYINLWKCEENLLSSNNISMDYSLLSIDILKLLTDFYLNHPDIFKKEDLSLVLKISENMPQKVELSFTHSLSKEYDIASHNLSNLSFNWPFLDYYKTQKKFHDLFLSIKNNIITDKNIAISTVNYKFSFNNPVGNFYFNKAEKYFSGIGNDATQAKLKLKEFNKSII